PLAALRRARVRIHRRVKNWRAGMARMNPQGRQAVFEACAGEYNSVAGRRRDRVELTPQRPPAATRLGLARGGEDRPFPATGGAVPDPEAAEAAGRLWSATSGVTVFANSSGR